MKILKQSEDALREFLLEVEIITALRHKNIISLSGFCFENEHLVLVYDFLPRGSLEDNLHGIKSQPQFFQGLPGMWPLLISCWCCVNQAMNRRRLHSVGPRDSRWPWAWPRRWTTCTAPENL